MFSKCFVSKGKPVARMVRIGRRRICAIMHDEHTDISDASLIGIKSGLLMERRVTRNAQK